jgi:hypothetical protein
MQNEVLKVIQASMHTMDSMTFDDEDNDAMSMDVPFPSVWIGSEVLRSVVCSTTLLATSQVAAHSVLYLPLSRSLSKKPILDSAPSVHISVLYPKSGGSHLCTHYSMCFHSSVPHIHYMWKMKTKRR